MVEVASKANVGRAILPTEAHRRLHCHFYAPKANLVVEVDGSQHLEPAQIDHDGRRTAFLESQGLRVLRFDNRQVLQELDGVMEEIYRAVAKEIGEGRS